MIAVQCWLSILQKHDMSCDMNHLSTSSESCGLLQESDAFQVLLINNLLGAFSSSGLAQENDIRVPEWSLCKEADHY